MDAVEVFGARSDFSQPRIQEMRRRYDTLMTDALEHRMTGQAALDISHDATKHEFYVVVEGQRCVLDYRLGNAVMTITHTGVPEAVGGRGIASMLVHSAFETARLQGWKVAPACSYAAAWIDRHPEYASLVA
jgi:uncharacterized protein